MTLLGMTLTCLALFFLGLVLGGVAVYLYLGRRYQEVAQEMQAALKQVNEKYGIE